MLFEPASEQVIRESVRDLKATQVGKMRERYDRALAYSNGEMIDDTVSTLRERFPSSFTGESGQDIAPYAIPLTQRYLDEAANAYNKPVERTFLDESTGEETDETKRQTTKLKHMLDDARYGEVMHLNERTMLLLDTSCPWYQAKRGKLYVPLVSPQYVTPVLPQDISRVDAADADDYDAFIVELFNGIEGAEASKRQFAWVTAAEVVYYEGSEQGVDQILSRHANPFSWPQVAETHNPDGSTTTMEPTDLPGRMMTFWHPRLTTGVLIPDVDVDVVHTNREINVMLSALVDAIRYQSHNTMVIHLNNPNDPKAQMRTGVRFPILVDINESVEMLQGAGNYSDQLATIERLVKLFAVAKRMSPNEFSTDAIVAQSGFAKLVDSLPKLEARTDKIRSLKHYEEQVAAPRLKAIGKFLGLLDSSVDGMRLRVKFADVEFPQTEAEKGQRIDRQIKHGFESAASILAAKDGITREEAEQRINDNKGQAQAEPPPEQQQPRSIASMLGGAIGRNK